MQSSRFLKHTLLYTALLSFVGIGLYLFSEENEGHQDFDAPSSAPLKNVASIPAVHTTTQPHFQGLDQKQQPYRITAALSMTNDHTSVTQLKEPTYTLDLHEGKTVHVTANHGVFDQEKKELVLTDNVVIVHDETSVHQHHAPQSSITAQKSEKNTKTIIRMPFVRIDLDTGFAEGDQSMHLSNNTMIARAGSFEIHDKGDKIVLTDKPSLRFSVKAPHDDRPYS